MLKVSRRSTCVRGGARAAGGEIGPGTSASGRAGGVAGGFTAGVANGFTGGSDARPATSVIIGL